MPTCGVTRKGIIGILTCVTQEELKSKKAQIETRITAKAAVLEGDPKFLNLIEYIVYNNKPVHSISMVSEELKWVINDKYCFNVDTGKVEN